MVWFAVCCVSCSCGTMAGKSPSTSQRLSLRTDEPTGPACNTDTTALHHARTIEIARRWCSWCRLGAPGGPWRTARGAQQAQGKKAHSIAYDLSREMAGGRGMERPMRRDPIFPDARSVLRGLLEHRGRQSSHAWGRPHSIDRSSSKSTELNAADFRIQSIGEGQA